MTLAGKLRLALFSALTLGIMCMIFLFSAQTADLSNASSDGFLSSTLGAFLARVLPSLSDMGLIHDIRKYAHMFEFCCLGMSSCLMFHEIFMRRGALAYAAPAWGMCLLYACSDEIHQLFVEGRSCQLSDVGVDAIGFSIGIVLILFVIAAAARIKRHHGVNLYDRHH